MAKNRMDVSAFVGKLLEESDVDLLREGVRILAQGLMDAEVSSQIGADLYERSEARTAHRNGYRTRTWDTRVGTVELRVPKIAPGTYFPALLEPRRRAERALAAVIQEAYVKGISKSEVSRICKELDREVEVFTGGNDPGRQKNSSAAASSQSGSNEEWLPTVTTRSTRAGAEELVRDPLRAGVRVPHGRLHGRHHRRGDRFRPGSAPPCSAGTGPPDLRHGAGEPMRSVLEAFGVAPDARLGGSGEASVYALDDRRVLRVPHTHDSVPNLEARRALLRELGRGAVPFELPEILDVGRVEGHAYAIERRLPGRPLMEELERAGGAARARLIEAHLDGAARLGDLHLEPRAFGDLLGPDAVKVLPRGAGTSRRRPRPTSRAVGRR
jgi:hypothetical protein